MFEDDPEVEQHPDADEEQATQRIAKRLDLNIGTSLTERAEAASRGERAPRIVSHEGVRARFARYRRTNGYNAVINARQLVHLPMRPACWASASILWLQ